MAGTLRKKHNRILLLVLLCGILIFTFAITVSLLPAKSVPPSDNPSVPPSSESASQQPSEPSSTLTEEQLFTNAAFVGNSCVERLFVQGYALQADFLSGVGLTVHSAFTEPPARLDQPITQLLASEKQYARIFILFGINEVGNDPDQFIDQYGVLIDHIKASQPQAQIFVQSIFPVTRATHERNLYLVNNDNIRLFNDRIQQMAEQKEIHYLDVYQALVNTEGFLPDDASTDGVHLSKSYNQIWINYLKEQVT